MTTKIPLELSAYAPTASGATLELQTTDTTVTDGSVLGKIEFKAPSEASGTDAILVGAAIEAVAEGTFAADNNATELLFKTGASEAAATKMRIDSSGRLGINRIPAITNAKLEVGGADNVPLINVEASGVTGGMGVGATGLQLFHGTTSRMKIDSTGAVIIPAQPAFLARPASEQSNLAINTDHTIVFGTEVFDQNADFASNTFTAPVSGKYQLNASVQFYGSDSATAYHHVKIITSNRAYQNIAALNKMSGDPAYWTFNVSVLADMDANDTAYVMVAIPNTGTAQADVTVESYFSGFLAC
tara:strand:+ start:369 stop:1271 length:903 start_codon:yes stop_codon:yes gene_type:complete